jgi:hypothetical protein
MARGCLGREIDTEFAGLLVGSWAWDLGIFELVFEEREADF